MSEFGQRLIEEVRKVAAENPDLDYKAPCLYVKAGKPSCLIGQALWRLGVIDADFEQDSSNVDGMRGVLDRLSLRVDGSELEWLCDVQNAQDTWATWGGAIKYADEAVVNDDEGDDNDRH